jgi:hypothetical protein
VLITNPVINVAGSDPVFDSFVACQNHNERGTRREEVVVELARIMDNVQDRVVARAVAQQIAEHKNTSGRTANLGWALLFHLGAGQFGKSSSSMGDAVAEAVRNYSYARALLNASFSQAVKDGVEPGSSKYGSSTERYIAGSVHFVDDKEALGAALDRFPTAREKVLIRYSELANADELEAAMIPRVSFFSDSVIRTVIPKLGEAARVRLGTDPNKGFILRRTALATLSTAMLQEFLGNVPENVANDVADVLAKR